MKRSTLALVESPAQLLNVVEWAVAAGATKRTRLMVLPPREATTQMQLTRMVELAREAGLGASWFEPRRSAVSLVTTVWEMFPRLAKAERLVIGDPFSRFVQAVLPLTDVADLVVVDDGTATLGFVAQLASGQQLSRWHLSEPGRGVVVDWLAQHTREYLLPAPDENRRVELFTAMPVAAPTGMTLTANRFDWTRGRFGPPTVKSGVDLIGTSLVETGVVSAERYLRGVETLASGGGRYYAHRRESDQKLREVARRTGLKIVRPDVPLEIVAARGPVSETLVSFPSTVVHTLPLILAGTGASLAVCDIPRGWLAHAEPTQAGDFLDGVTASAPAAATRQLG